jgi:hypothetical protein
MVSSNAKLRFCTSSRIRPTVDRTASATAGSCIRWCTDPRSRSLGPSKSACGYCWYSGNPSRCFLARRDPSPSWMGLSNPSQYLPSLVGVLSRWCITNGLHGVSCGISICVMTCSDRYDRLLSYACPSGEVMLRPELLGACLPSLSLCHTVSATLGRFSRFSSLWRELSRLIEYLSAWGEPMLRLLRCSSLPRELSCLVVGSSARVELLGRLSLPGELIPSFRRDPGRVTTSKLGTSLFSCFAPLARFRGLAARLGSSSHSGPLFPPQGVAASSSQVFPVVLLPWLYPPAKARAFAYVGCFASTWCLGVIALIPVVLREK